MMPDNIRYVIFYKKKNGITKFIGYPDLKSAQIMFRFIKEACNDITEVMIIKLGKVEGTFFRKKD